ncbi:MAG TPA: glycosyltransferase, partial [Vitreimonas sp.]|nr:glycosyltransferase [Vitreimonas sp.]
MTPRRMPIFIVASWYPGVDDPARGRFVADQADALAQTGMMEPLILSFDSAIVDGDQVERVAELGTVTRHRRQALADHPDAINRSAWGLPPGIPTSRLPVLAGIGRATPGGSDGDLRREAILDFVDRLDLRDSPPGIVHAHTAYPDGYAAAALAKRLGWPLVITEHASFVARQLRQPAERQRYLEAVATAARFLAVSEVLAGELAAAIPELAGKLEV